MKSRSQAILVLGMHRSGTSALTGTLALLGAYPGPSLMPGVAGVNPKGFWEHAEIVAMHDWLLQSLGSSWDDAASLPDQWWQLPVIAPTRAAIAEKVAADFGKSPLWLLKDPRLCRLSPLWLDILQTLDCSPKFVVALRHPAEVARSLVDRDAMHVDHAALLWLDAMCHAELYSRPYPRCFIRYEDLLADWRTQIRRIATQLDVPLDPESHGGAEVDAFLDATLRHQRENVHHAAPDSPVWQAAMNCYRMLANPASPDALAHATDTLLSAIPGIRVALLGEGDGAYRLWSLEHELQGKRRQLEFASRQADVLQAQLRHMQSSWSWRITRPLRNRTLEKLACALGIRNRHSARKTGEGQ